jgi:hypothetical protein
MGYQNGLTFGMMQHGIEGAATLNRVVTPSSKLAFEQWWATTAGPRFTKVPLAATDHHRFWEAMDNLDTARLAAAERSIAAKMVTEFGLDLSGRALVGVVKTFGHCLQADSTQRRNTNCFRERSGDYRRVARVSSVAWVPVSADHVRRAAARARAPP